MSKTMKSSVHLGLIQEIPTSRSSRRRSKKNAKTDRGPIIRDSDVLLQCYILSLFG